MVSEKRSLNILVIYMYMYNAPVWGQISPWGPNFFRITNLQSICLFPSNNILTIYPIQMHGRPMLTLPKIGQCHPRVMIYINFVELLSLMLHAKFQNHWPSGSGEKIYKRFCYLKPWWPSWSRDPDHLYKLSFPVSKNAPHKVWL